MVYLQLIYFIIQNSCHVLDTVLLCCVCVYRLTGIICFANNNSVHVFLRVLACYIGTETAATSEQKVYRDSCV